MMRFIQDRLVTDDSKEDWWHIQGDRTIGPRPELISEFLTETGQQFYMYSSDRFMGYAENFLNKDIKKQAIEEVKERFQERLRAALEIKSGNIQKTSPLADIVIPDFVSGSLKTEDFKALFPSSLFPASEKSEGASDKINS